MQMCPWSPSSPPNQSTGCPRPLFVRQVLGMITATTELDVSYTLGPESRLCPVLSARKKGKGNRSLARRCRQWGFSAFLTAWTEFRGSALSVTVLFREHQVTVEAQSCGLWAPNQAFPDPPHTQATHEVKEGPGPAVFPARPLLWTIAWPGQEARGEKQFPKLKLCAGQDEQGGTPLGAFP